MQVWSKSKDLAIQIYRLTNKEPFSRDFRFKDQIRSAAVSVPSNIAEGDELDTNKQSIRHFYIAKGSAAEVITQLIIAQEIGYLEKKETIEMIDQYEHLSHMLSKLINSRKP